MNRDDRHGKVSYRCNHPIIEHSFASYMEKSNRGKREITNWFTGSGNLDHDLDSLLRHVKDLEAKHHGLYVYKEKHVVKGLEHETTHYLHKPVKNLPKGWKEVSTEDCVNASRFNLGLYLLDYLKNKAI